MYSYYILALVIFKGLIFVVGEKIYWSSTGSYPTIETAFLNGTERTTLYTDSSAQFTGITLRDNILYISDSSRR